jgi:hypothetical protein
MWTVTTVLLQAILDAIYGHALPSGLVGPLDAVYVGLYIAPTAPINQNSLLSNITEATYDGYARQEIVWFPTFIDQAGPQTLEGASLFFSPTDATVPNTITGIFIASALTGGVLLAAQALATPGVPLIGPSNALTVVPQFQLPFQQIYGGGQLVP